jgi:predicted RNA-binding Zn ribbon-like protein
MRLRHPDGQVFSFDAGTLSLELSSTTGGEGFRARFEILHTPADFPRWAATSRLGVDPSAVVASAADLALVKRLREAIWAGAYSLATGGVVARRDADAINDVAAGEVPVPQIGSDGAPTWRRPLSAAHLAAAIARDAVGTLTLPRSTRVRMCAADDCYLIYLDTSRPGNRRWCSMDRCGNRAKVRDHRRRKEES